jgi:hypothetical protein
MVIALGAVLGLYFFVVTKTGDAVTQYNVYQQSNDLMKAIESTASNAISCQNVTLGSVTALKCTMPDSGTDTDNDGIIDKYRPTGVLKTLQEYYSPGKRVWYFPSTKPVSVGTAGSFWYRAVIASDATITSSNVDSRWSYVNGTTPRIYIPGTVTFSQNTSGLSTTVQISINPNAKPNADVTGYSENLGIKLPAVTLNRLFYWRHGF